MSITFYILMAVVGVAQGFLNTVAGGGSLLVLPVMTFMGVDLAVANGTNRIAILLQSIAGATSFKKQGALSMKVAIPLAICSTIGAAFGAMIASTVDKRVLNIAVAICISIMAVLLIAKPKMWEGGNTTRCPKYLTYLIFVGLGFYGGFIQAGAGFFFSWGLVVAAGLDLVKGNAVKTVIIGSYTTISLAIFYINGLVNIPMGLVLAVGSSVGAVLGAKFTVAKGNNWVRYILAIVVIISAAKMFMDVFK